MKKFITLALALVLTLSMTVCVFAETLTAASPSASAEVKGNYATGDAAPETISVGITWVDVLYTYQLPDSVWNTETHQPETTGTAAWTTPDDAKFSVTVTNDSNVAVVATIAATSTVATATMNIVEGDAELAAAAGSTVESVKSELTMSGDPVAAFENGSVIATVTVTIAKA